MERPAGVVRFTPDPALYPFTSRWFDSRVGPVHHLDEGQGRPLLLLHGNPDWSFLYRKVVVDLRRDYRCVAPDYPGFGLSVHPSSGYGYTPREHAEVVGALVDHLGLDGMVVVGQDWGGPIGMDVASRRAERVHGIVMGNTLCWPADTFRLRSFSRIMGSPPLQWLITERNFFVSPFMRLLLQVELSDEEFAHYTDVLPTPASRAGVAAFPPQFLASHRWFAALERRVRAQLGGTRAAFVFGRRDPAFGGRVVIERWRQLYPTAPVVELPGAGHYLQEDAHDALVRIIRTTFPPF